MKHGFISWRVAFVGLSFAALALGVAYRFGKLPGGSFAPPHRAPEQDAGQSVTPSGQSAEDSEPREVAPSDFANASQLPAVIQPTSRSTPAAKPAVVRAEASPYTRQLVAGLTNLDFSHGPITKEQAAQ